MAKNIMDGGYQDFIKFFQINFPALAIKFGKDIKWSFMDGCYGVMKPSDMSTEDFDEFRRIELEWKIKNEYFTQYQDNPAFVVVLNGLTNIPTNKVNFVRKLTDNSTTISMNDINGDENVYDVVGDIDYVNKKLGIS